MQKYAWISKMTASTYNHNLIDKNSYKLRRIPWGTNLGPLLFVLFINGLLL